VKRFPLRKHEVTDKGSYPGYRSNFKGGENSRVLAFSPLSRSRGRTSYGWGTQNVDRNIPIDPKSLEWEGKL